MIEALLKADDGDDFVSAVRALDRVLLSGDYVIPLFYLPRQWVAHWRDLKRPGEDAALRLSDRFLVARARGRRFGQRNGTGALIGHDARTLKRSRGSEKAAAADGGRAIAASRQPATGGDRPLRSSQPRGARLRRSRQPSPIARPTRRSMRSPRSSSRSGSSPATRSWPSFPISRMAPLTLLAAWRAGLTVAAVPMLWRARRSARCARRSRRRR